MFAIHPVINTRSHSRTNTALGMTLILLGMTACQSRPEDVSREVVGTATYRERISLPDEAQLMISLVDMANPADAGPTIAEFSRLDPGSPPYSFRLPYLEKAVDPNGSYGVDAQISAAGETLFHTPEPVPVLTGGSPDDGVEVLMIRSNNRATPFP